MRTARAGSGGGPCGKPLVAGVCGTLSLFGQPGALRSCFILLYLANFLKRLIAAQCCFHFVPRELDSGDSSLPCVPARYPALRRESAKAHTRLFAGRARFSARSSSVHSADSGLIAALLAP